MLFINPFQNLLSWPAVDAAMFFDGYLLRGAELTGVADGKTGTVSAWVYLETGNGAMCAILTNSTGGTGFRVIKDNLNKFTIRGVNAAGTTILNMSSVSTHVVGGGWVHLMASWDLATLSTHLYINGVSDKSVATVTNDVLDYTKGNWGVGAYTDGSLYFRWRSADFYFSSSYIDLSIESNRLKLLSANRRTVPMGADGSLPTGAAPLIFLHLNDGQAVADFNTNLGTGGGFNKTGSILTSNYPYSPSD